MEDYYKEKGRIMNFKELSTKVWFWAALFAIWNVFMYYFIGKFWIGGSSFLPLIGFKVEKFLIPLTINLGLITGAFISAVVSKEFFIRKLNKETLIRAVIGGFLMGIGFTLAPGTCTTPFVTGMPMLGVNSFLSALGIIIGAYIGYKIVMRKG